MLQKTPRKVALLIESSRSYGRGLLRGIARFAGTRANWSMRHQEMRIDADPPAWLSRQEVDGVLARIESPRMLDALRHLNRPTVDLRCLHTLSGVPRFETDDRRVMEMAAEHFLKRGFRRFAYCGFAGVNYSMRRLKFLRAVLSESSISPKIYESPGRRTMATPHAELLGMLDEVSVGDWLKSLTAHTALICCNDIRAQQVMNVCRSVGVLVPDELAILGVDNDDVICPLCDPPLSSVQPDTERLGYEAARALDEMLDGSPPPPVPVFIPPIQVITRQSTEVHAVDDWQVARACRLIRRHACDGINVADVTRSLSISRRQLERRFRASLQTTPHREIVRHKIQRVQELLRDSDMTLDEIARSTGFSYAERVSLAFKQHTGETPSQFRSRSRLSA